LNASTDVRYIDVSHAHEQFCAQAWDVTEWPAGPPTTVFTTNAAAFLVVLPAAGIVELAADVVESAIGSATRELGLRALLRIAGRFASATLRGDAGGGDRGVQSALTASLETWDALGDSERLALLELLDSPNVDGGNTFGDFLRAVSDSRRMAEAGEPESLWRRRWITWLLGQTRVDLPYDRAGVERVLRADLEPDDARIAVHQVVQDYDSEIERENALRISRDVAWAEEELIFGRMSRAFHNQGLLFAHSRHLTISDAMAQAAESLTQAASWEGIRPALDRIHLLVQPGREAPLTELAGALDHLEEQALRHQRALAQDALQKSREQVETATPDVDADRVAGEEVADIMRTGEAVLRATADLRRSMLEAPHRRAAYVIMNQRIFPPETHILAKINQGYEPYPGKQENLRRLALLAADRIYASPSYLWLEHATHWIEAIPLFIKERIRVVDGQETTETVIDQAGMEESFRELMAEPWARNLRATELSGYCAIARALLSEDDPARADLKREADIARAWNARQDVREDEVAALAAAVCLAAEASAHAISERHETAADGDRMVAVRSVLLNDEVDDPLWKAVRAAAESAGDWTGATSSALTSASEEVRTSHAELLDEIGPVAELPRRPLPALHVLTTQSANMTDGYIRSWLEESMALANVVRAHGLTDAVDARRAEFDAEIETLGAAIIDELGIAVEVETLVATEQISRADAVHRIIGANRLVQQQVGVLGVLREAGASAMSANGIDPESVDAFIAEHESELRKAALADVIQRNAHDIEVRTAALRAEGDNGDEEALRERIVLEDADYEADLRTFVRFAARERLFEQMDCELPERKLDARRQTWLREHQKLAKTTARKQIVAEAGLNHLTLDPRYYYQATGGSKRYHLLYTPSRVDLGPKERDSVETWSQWVGGLDRPAAQAGRRIYSLINKGVKRFDSLTEPEVLKTGENASMASHLAYSNAMALMVHATGRGDMEEIGDQMSLREDRIIHPAGEGYGGYCVPKDGLFLEFVLTLSEGVKLQQLGVEEQYHRAVADLAYQVLLKRTDFPTELAWEAWAERMLADHDAMREVLQIRTRDEGDGVSVQVPVFQITRLANVLDRLGQPPLREHQAMVRSLAARWGIHTMIAGGEHVNRFMPFYKVWLTYDALSRACRADGGEIDLEDAVIVLSAEYKPDTQDGRFSVGMRKYEIYARTGDHLRYSLGAEAGTLAAIMIDGWGRTSQVRGPGDPGLQRIAAQWGLDIHDAGANARLAELFPGFPVPREMRLVSTMGLATQDVVRYTSDATLEQMSDALKERLYAFGLDDSDIEANMATFGPRLERWAKLRGNPDAKELIDGLDGRVHALALAVLGPERSYERAVQGADVFDVGIAHKEIVELLESPAKVRDLMLHGRPNSALVIVDGGSGARRRTMARRGVMRWFAAGDQIGRTSIYRAVGLGEDTVESWRTRMCIERDRAEDLRESCLAGDTAELEERVRSIVSVVRDEQEALLALEEEERLMRFRRASASDHTVSHLLAEVARMVAPAELTFPHWLAVGGAFILEGCSESELLAAEQEFADARQSHFGVAPDADEHDLVRRIITPLRRTYGTPFRQEGGVESSNKATEEVAVLALNTRRQLAARARRVMSLRDRLSAFERTRQTEQVATVGVAEVVASVHDVLGNAPEFDSDEALGVVIARTGMLADLLVDQYCAQDVKADLGQRFGAVLDGRELDPEAVRSVCGGYEEIGAIGRLGQSVLDLARREGWAQDRRRAVLDEVASLAEFIDVVRALDATLAYRQEAPDDAEAAAIWRDLATYFAETLNDHFFEYRPWSYARGIGFDEFQGDELYELADRHHRWLYGYLRAIIVARTEMRHRSAEDQALLLGNLGDDTVDVAVCASATTEPERRWRAYNHLREIAFIRNDGFPLPPAFDAFDPSLIDAQNRVNLVALYPVGRTHISRLLAEGPTLARELERDGQSEANILIARQGVVRGDRFVIEDAHLYVNGETYIAALRKHVGYTDDEAQRAADRDVGPKGVRIAARFSEPITAALVMPMHGNPVYDSGELEQLGLPYSTQSRYHTWTTYDKAKYPSIFTPDTGVAIPDEVDWLHEWTAGADRDTTIEQIRRGRADDFAGLEAFAGRHRIIMVKDAAESGGRAQKAFEVRSPNGELLDDAILEATEFLYQISLRHNVAVQEVVVTSPETWATEEFLARFSDRQILDWSRAIVRDRQPQTPLFGSFRVILSTDQPSASDRERHWHVSHPITLNSTQLITNVGRGGTLEILYPTDIRPEHRSAIMAALEDAGRKTMEAMAAYEVATAEQYEAETGDSVGKDLTGVSYGVPRYLMLDFLLRPVFDSPGELIDVLPDVGDDGDRVGSRFLLRDGDDAHEGQIVDWEAIMIEPNIGIGLWDRVAIREEVHESERAEAENREMDWDRVGENARIVLRDWARAGSDYIDALGRKA